MTPDQFAQLLALLAKIADHPYTITGAADWPILAVMGTLLGALIAFMWHDLGAKIIEHKRDDEKAHDAVWRAMRDCKDDCCVERHRGEK